MIISIINNTSLHHQEVQDVIRAVNRQLQQDFKRYWHKDVQLRLEGWTGEKEGFDGAPDPDNPIDMRGDAVLYLWEEEDVADALGYHALTSAGVPYGFVFTRLSELLSENWSVTLSHEALEMAMDAEINLLAQGPHPDPNENGRTVYHWYELCDAVQADTYLIDGVEVSNFVLPLYFTEGEEHDNHNDFLGLSTRSFKTRPGGYVGFYDPESGEHENYIDPHDEIARDRAAKKALFKLAKRSGRRGGDLDPLTDPGLVRFESITFEVKPESEHTSRTLAESIISSHLGEAWSVQGCMGDQNEFDATPPNNQVITFAEAWQWCHDMMASDEVEFAEPSFQFPIPGETDLAPDLRALSFGGDDQPEPGTQDPEWALTTCNVQKAWEYVRSHGLEPGAGVKIGHPDSGYLEHPEMDLDRVLLSMDWDFVDDDDDTLTNRRKHGRHGLSTASVIMSAEAGTIKGAAPAAKIIPLRVTKPGLLRPTPVLLFGGMRKLRDAIDYARGQDCQVISMSLGGTPSRSVAKAIKRANRAGIIVLAAAGNQVKIVVYPARYDECIAVAGCNINLDPWRGSSRGKTVDVTAPGESVWRASVRKTGEPFEGPGSGTSYAVAVTAGVAAVWRAFHAAKLETLPPAHIPVLFRNLLKETAQAAPNLPKSKYGAGVVDAEALLKATLPEVRRARPRGMSAQLRADLKDDGISTADKFDDAELQELQMATMLRLFCLESEPMRVRQSELKEAEDGTNGVRLMGLSRHAQHRFAGKLSD